jgi:hypothetical protein
MTIKTLIENALYLFQKLDIFGTIDDIKSQRKYDLNGDDDDTHNDDLEEIEMLMENLETAYNELADKLEEMQNKIDSADDEKDE